MLEVHPPHGAVHTWKDFLIHVATITVGLLIAVGLEQTVEYFHHRSQLQSARRELAAEVEENRRGAELYVAALGNVSATLDKNMELLRANQAAHVPLNGQLEDPFNSARNAARPRDGVWQSLKQVGALDLMSHAELQAYAHAYAVMGSFMDALTMTVIQLDVVAAIAQRSSDGRTSPRDIDELVSAISEAQGRLIYLTRVLQYERIALARASKGAAITSDPR